MEGFPVDYTVFLTGCRGMAQARLTMIVVGLAWTHMLSKGSLRFPMAASSPFLVYRRALPLAMSHASQASSDPRV